MAAPNFEDDHSEGTVRFVWTYTGAVSIPAGTSKGFRPTHRFAKFVIHNTGTKDLLWAFNKAAAAAGHGGPLCAGASFTLDHCQDHPLIVVREHDGLGDAEVALYFLESRALPSGIEITSTDHFPAFDDSDGDSIVPGVSV